MKTHTLESHDLSSVDMFFRNWSQLADREQPIRSKP